MRRPTRLILALLLPLAAALPPAPAVAQANRVVAVVNGDAISRADVEGRRRLFTLSAGTPATPIALDRLNDQVLRLLIDERLRMQEVRRRRIPVSDTEVAQAVGEIEARNNLPRGGLREQLRRSGIEPRVLYDQLRAQIGWSRLLRQLLGPQSQPSDQDVQDFMAGQRARTGQPEYLIAEIFIPIDEPGEEADARRFVEEVIAQLRRGLPFPVAATQFSQAQTNVQGGDLGWVYPDQLDPAIARLVTQMPTGAVSNAVRVPGGFQIITLRSKRETGRDMATLMTARQAFFPFQGELDPSAPTQQQIQAVERGRALSASARSCDAIEAGARAANSPRPADIGEFRLEALEPPALRQLMGGLAPGRASQPLISPDGVLVVMVCTKETRNLADITPDQARGTLLRDRVELLSRQLQRDLRRRAAIDIRSEQRTEPRGG